jgi:hypothetical protein
MIQSEEDWWELAVYFNVPLRHDDNTVEVT